MIARHSGGARLASDSFRWPDDPSWRPFETGGAKWVKGVHHHPFSISAVRSGSGVEAGQENAGLRSLEIPEKVQFGDAEGRVAGKSGSRSDLRPWALRFWPKPIAKKPLPELNSNDCH